MARRTPEQPSELYSLEELNRILDKIGIPTPLRQKIKDGVTPISPEQLIARYDVRDIIDELPEEAKRGLERQAIKILKGEVGEEARDELKRDLREQLLREGLKEEVEADLIESVEKKVGLVYDLYLVEVAERVFGFKLSDLSGEERMQIAWTRQDLKIPGAFDPNP